MTASASLETTHAPAAVALRASDADRHAVVMQLQDAVARGLLSTEEGSERMAGAYDARYLHDLPPLTADLPSPVPVAQPTGAPGWPALVAMLWHQLCALIAGPGGRPSRRRLAVVSGIVLALVVLLVLGAEALHGLADGPHGHADFAGH